MILVDTSAWVEFLRDTGSRAARRVSRLLAGEVATTDVVVMEVLAGARDDAHLERLRRLMMRCVHLSTEPGYYEVAAAVWRACRRAGDTPRSLTDCLIASVALRETAAVCHADRDFEVIARHLPLRLDR